MQGLEQDDTDSMIFMPYEISEKRYKTRSSFCIGFTEEFVHDAWNERTFTRYHLLIAPIIPLFAFTVSFLPSFRDRKTNEYVLDIL